METNKTHKTGEDEMIKIYETKTTKRGTIDLGKEIDRASSRKQAIELQKFYLEKYNIQTLAI